ncbi:MAG: FAD-binding oxidoreductase, partial [Chloroflexi bacterium]
MANRVAIIGGGIIGCTTAGLLAEAGSQVTLVEATAIGAGASGRNSGTIQHPFDPVLLPLHLETVEAYHALAAADPEFRFPAEPVGILLLTDDIDAGTERAAELAAAFPDLAPEMLDTAATSRAEPSLAQRWAAVRVATGYPVVPEAATHAMAARAVRAGATIRIGRAARPWIENGQVRGLAFDDGERLAADGVLVAGGPWTPGVLGTDLAWPPVARTWGVTIQVAMADPPSHVLEEG